MNKIVIVGHPASGHEEVLALLQKCGMSVALPSRREGMLPQAITATLCKAHKVVPLESVTDEEQFAQIEAAPVWQGMALDLMLGNLDQSFWGWSDPQAIYALDYWQELDPHLTFVLVYDEPHRALMEAALAQSDVDDAAPMQDLRRLLDNWVAYNGALLRFHLRHAGRSLLVHGTQVQRATDRYVEQLQPLLDLPLPTSGEVAALPGPQAREVRPALMPLPQELNSALSAAGIEPHQAAALLQADAAERYLIDDLLAHHPAVTQLYAELQSVANLPLDAQPREAQGAAAEAWRALTRQRGFVTGLVVRLHGEMQHASEAASRNQLALQEERQAGAKLQAQAQESLDVELGRLQDFGRDNEVLLTQLHRVQQELEQYYLRLRDSELAKEGAERDRRRCRRRLEEMERAKEIAETAAGELRGAAEDNKLLLIELEKVRKDRRRYRRRLEEAEVREADVERTLGEVRREVASLKSRPPDLSIVYSKALLSTLVRRLVSKVVPKSLVR